MSSGPLVLNDIHSRLNATEVSGVVRPRDVAELRAAVGSAIAGGWRVSVSGGRHAMGGQQLGAGTLNLDMTGLTDVRAFDAERGLLTIGAGADWPAIIAASDRAQIGDDHPPADRRAARWGIRQKQTGADRLTLGGAIAANAHGRGLLMQPIGSDIEDLEVVTVDGRGGTQLVRCSRGENAELFSLVIGGYGLLGIVTAATLRLGPRMKMRRLVDIIDIDDAMNAVRRRVADGCIYGDFQYAIDPADDSFLRRGVFACYEPVPDDTPLSDASSDLREEQWLELLRLAHTDKRQAFAAYSAHYLQTHGRVYWSDTMQLSMYVPSYAEFLARGGTGLEGGTGRQTGRGGPGLQPDDVPEESLVIGEMCVPPDRLLPFMAAARRVLRQRRVEDIYGTIRSIRRDQSSFMPWAREDFACVIFNLRTPHTAEGLARTEATFRGLIASGGAAVGLRQVQAELVHERFEVGRSLLYPSHRLFDMLDGIVIESTQAQRGPVQAVLGTRPARRTKRFRSGPFAEMEPQGLHRAVPPDWASRHRPAAQGGLRNKHDFALRRGLRVRAKRTVSTISPDRSIRARSPGFATSVKTVVQRRAAGRRVAPSRLNPGMT
jgi:FAD/FMN-containing dehydrogenase